MEQNTTTPAANSHATGTESAHPWKRRISALFLAAAVLLLAHTCRVCIPQVGAAFDRIAAYSRQSSVWHAFSALSGTLGEGGGVAEAFSRSYQVLTGAAD